VRSLQVALQAVPKNTTPAFKQANTKASTQGHVATFVLTLPVMAGSAVISVYLLKTATTLIFCCDSKTRHDKLPLLTTPVPIPQLSTTRLVCCGA